MRTLDIIEAADFLKCGEDTVREPSNCRWASKKEQANNTRRNVFLEHNGKRMTIQQWAEYLAIPHDRIRGRLRLGFTTEEALSLTNNNFGKRHPGIRRGK